MDSDGKRGNVPAMVYVYLDTIPSNVSNVQDTHCKRNIIFFREDTPMS